MEGDIPKRDNYTWVNLKNRINKISNKDKFQLYSYSWENDKIIFINTLIRLDYIKPIVVSDNCHISIGYFKRIKEIPEDLYWKDARELAKQNGKKLNRGKKPFTNWTLAVDAVNNHKKDTFNRNDFSESLYTYFSMLSRLGYLERLDRKGNYKIIQKIPESLSSATANLMLYDKMYKRKVKIEKLKEKLVDKTNI